MRRTGSLVAIFGALSLLCASVAFADAGRVDVQVDVVHASDKGKAIDPPSLKHMQESFSQSGFNYSSYRRLSSQRLSLAPNQAQQVKLPNGRTATLTLKDVSANVAHIHVSVPPLETTYALGREGSVFIQGGPQGGGMLILVLSPVH